MRPILVFLAMLLMSALAPAQSATNNPGAEARPATPSRAATAVPTPQPAEAVPPKDAATQPAEPETVQALKALEQDWQASIRRHDLQALNLILAPDFRQITASGQVLNREQAIAAADAGGVHDGSLQDMDVRIYSGQFAVVTGVNAGDNRLVRFTDVFLYRQGRWQAVSSEETPAR